MPRILGIDPGTARLGYAILDDKNGTQTLIDCGILETHKDKSQADRLFEIRTDLEALIEEFKPDTMSVEELFFFRNLTTIIPVAQARGVILELAARNGYELFEFTPPQVKQIITGNGKADKKDVERMVKNILKIDIELKPDDAADAVAIALCATR